MPASPIGFGSNQNPVMAAGVEKSYSKGLHSTQMAQNVQKILSRKPGEIQSGDQIDANKMVEAAKQITESGNEAMGAELDTKIVRGLTTSQMTDNSSNMVSDMMDAAGTNQTKGQANLLDEIA